MFSPHEIPDLQKAAEDEVLRRSFKTIGIFSLAFGALALFAGIAPPPDLLLLAVGGLLAVTGLWNLMVKNPAGLLLSALAIALVGAYNVASPFVAVTAGGKPSTVWAVLGFWQLVWGWQGYRRWQRFRGGLQVETPSALRQRAAQLIDGLRKAKVKQEPDVVEMIAGGFTPTLLRLRLGPDVAACLVGGGDDIHLAPRSQVALETEQEHPKVVKGTLVIGERRWKGQLKAEHAERFRRWQHGESSLRQAA